MLHRFAIATLAVSLVAAPAVTPASVTLRGEVRDSAGDPLAGATIRLLPSRLEAWTRDRDPHAWIDPIVVETGDDASFVIAVEADTTYSVRVEATHHAAALATEVGADEPLNVRLDTGGSLTGRVLDARRRQPIAGATLRACDRGGFIFDVEVCPETRTDADGRYVIDHLAHGEIQLVARGQGFETSAVERVTLDDETPRAGVDFFLAPGARVTGRVVDQAGAGVPHVRVETRPDVPAQTANVDKPRWPVFTNAEGDFDLAGVRAGARTRVVAHRGDRPRAVAGPFDIVAGVARSDLRIVMPAAALLRVRLVDADEQPLTDVELFVRRAGRGESSVPVDRLQFTDDGRLDVAHLESGVVDLRIVPAGYLGLVREQVELLPGEITDLGTVVAEHGRSVNGRVTDPDELPIDDATVVAFYTLGDRRFQHSTVTDGGGAYTIEGLPEIGVELNAGAAGYQQTDRRAVAPEIDEADFVLLPLSRLAGQVRLEGGGVPQLFEVSAHREVDASTRTPGPPRRRSFTDAEGAYELSDVEPGRYTVEARAEGFAPGRKSGVVALSAQRTEVETIVLPEGLSLTGRVVAARDGQALAGASVEARGPGGWLEGSDDAAPARAMSDESGRFELGGLPEGRLRVSARHPGFSEREVEIELANGARAPELVLELTGGGTLVGTVRDRDGRPEINRTISLGAVLDGSADRVDQTHAATDEHGAYVIEGIPPGSHRVALLPGSAPTDTLLWKTAVIREGERTVLDFDNAPRIRLAGTVLIDNRPLPMATLLFAPARSGLDWSDFQMATTGADGRYAVGLEQPGEYRVVVSTETRLNMSTSVDVPDEDDVFRDIVLDRGGIAGTVYGVDDTPRSGATVMAQPLGAGAGSDSLLIAESDAAGLYAIRGLGAGVYRVTASVDGEGYAVVDAAEVVDAGLEVRVDLRLRSGAALHGRLTDEQGRGIAGGVVFVSPAGAVDGIGVATAETDVNGSFRVDAPSDGALDLTGFARGWAPARRLGVTAGEDEIVLALDAGGRIRVQTVRPDGEPVPAVPLAVSPLPPFPGSQLIRLLSAPPSTGADGVAWVERLAPGLYEISVPGRPSAPAQRITVHQGVDSLAVLEIVD